jgi:hypothetical protein
LETEEFVTADHPRCGKPDEGRALGG